MKNIVNLFVVFVASVFFVTLVFSGGCDTKKVTELKLPEDFVEMQGSPSMDRASIYVTYINKDGELKTKKYGFGLGIPGRIHWKKPAERIEK